MARFDPIGARDQRQRDRETRETERSEGEQARGRERKRRHRATESGRFIFVAPARLRRSVCFFAIRLLSLVNRWLGRESQHSAKKRKRETERERERGEREVRDWFMSGCDERCSPIFPPPVGLNAKPSFVGAERAFVALFMKLCLPASSLETTSIFSSQRRYHLLCQGERRGHERGNKKGGRTDPRHSAPDTFLSVTHACAWRRPVRFNPERVQRQTRRLDNSLKALLFCSVRP